MKLAILICLLGLCRPLADDSMVVTNTDIIEWQQDRSRELDPAIDCPRNRKDCLRMEHFI